MYLNKQDIMEDLDIIQLANALNIKYIHKHGILCICPFHNDKNFGSAFLKSYRDKGELKKGISCFACHKFYNAPTIVMELLGLDYLDSLKYLAELNGDVERYTDNSLDEDYADTTEKQKQIKKNKKNFSEYQKYGLTLEEEEMLFNKKEKAECYPIKIKNISFSSIRPNDKDCFRNDLYSYNTEKNISEYVCYDMIEDSYTSLRQLFTTDFEAYHCMVVDKCMEEILKIDSCLKRIKKYASESAVSLQYILEKRREDLCNIILKTNKKALVSN